MGLLNKFKDFASSAGGGSLIGGGIGLVGGILANQASAKSAREQMQFQERLSNTSHQREVADLRAAGLNPILSANSGASSPGGASYTAANVGDAAVSSGLQAARTGQDIKLSKANVNTAEKLLANIVETNRLIQAQTEAAGASAEASSASAAKARAETLGVYADNMIKNYNIPAAKVAAELTQDPNYRGYKLADIQMQGGIWPALFKYMQTVGLNPNTTGKGLVQEAGSILAPIEGLNQKANQSGLNVRKWLEQKFNLLAPYIRGRYR